MSDSPSTVQADGFSFDVAGILSAIEGQLWLVLLLLFIGFIFWIFQKGGFAEKYLESQNRKRELDAKQVESLREIAHILSDKYKDAEPFLPLPGFSNDEEER